MAGHVEPGGTRMQLRWGQRRLGSPSAMWAESSITREGAAATSWIPRRYLFWLESWPNLFLGRWLKGLSWCFWKILEDYEVVVGNAHGNQGAKTRS